MSIFGVTSSDFAREAPYLDFLKMENTISKSGQPTEISKQLYADQTQDIYEADSACGHQFETSGGPMWRYLTLGILR